MSGASVSRKAAGSIGACGIRPRVTHAASKATFGGCNGRLKEATRERKAVDLQRVPPVLVSQPVREKGDFSAVNIVQVLDPL